MVVEIRDWCQNVGKYNTYNFCIWHFGLYAIVSKIDRCRSSDPPYEIAINPIFRSYRVSDVIIQSFLNRSRWNLVHTLVARRARSAISDCLVLFVVTSPPVGGGRGIVMPMSVCVCVCPCFRKISKCNISAISQPIIMKLGIHITSKVKVVGRRKVKNVIWPYLGNEWS